MTTQKMLTSRAFACVLAVSLLAIAPCPPSADPGGLSGDPSQQNCGFDPVDQVPRPELDSCAPGIQLATRESIGDAGLLKTLGLWALPFAFSPNGDGVRDTTSFSVNAEWIRGGHSDQHSDEHADSDRGSDCDTGSPGRGDENGAQRAPIVYVAVFEIVSGSSCRLVTSLVVEQQGGKSASLSATWNGTDLANNVVPPGTYFYRATVSVFALRPHTSRTLIDVVRSKVQAVQVTPDDEVPLPLVFGPAPRLAGGVVELPAPRLRPYTMAVAETLRDVEQASRAARADLPAWIARYRAASLHGQPSLAIVRLISDDGPVVGQDLRASTWSSSETVAGPAMPSTFRMLQPSPNGGMPSDGVLLGETGRLYVIVAERWPSGEYRMTLDDETGTTAFAVPGGSDSWSFERGALFTRAQLDLAAANWP